MVQRAGRQYLPPGDWGAKLKAVLSDDGRNTDLLKRLLFGCSRAYGRIVETRFRRLQNRQGGIKQLPRPVISVGNLTTGGTGKTPMAAYLARLLLSWGLRPAILSRGYGGSAMRRGAIVSTGEGPRVPVSVSGDEAHLLAQRLPKVPVVVGRNRYSMGVRALEQLELDCFILDDGYQHIQLHRDLNLALLDYRRPFGNGHMLPRGHLREPLTALTRADALILTRSDLDAAKQHVLEKRGVGKPLFRAAHRTIITQRWVGGKWRPDGEAVGLPEREKVFIFSGLADNAAFQEAAGELGGRLVGARSFADHHPYTPRDVDLIVQAAREAGADRLLTTAKDFVRLPRPLTFATELVVVDAELLFDGDGFNNFFRRQLTPLVG